MTKNITLRMDEDLLRQLKHIAVEHDMSLSAWISDLVRRAAASGAEAEYKKEKIVYEQAKSTVLKAMEDAVDYGTGGKTFSREQLLRCLNNMAAEHHVPLSDWISQLADDAARWEVSHEQQQTTAWSVMEKTFHLGGEKFDREACYDRVH